MPNMSVTDKLELLLGNNSRLTSAFNNFFISYYNHKDIYAGVASNPYCSGRTIKSLYKSYQFNDIINNLEILCASIFTQTHYFKITPHYLTVSNGEVTTNTISSIQDLLDKTYHNASTSYMNTPNYSRINVIHVSSGKSHVSHILENELSVDPKDTINLPGIEQLLKQHNNHFIKVYKNLKGSPRPDDITVFTDVVNMELMQGLLIQFANFFIPAPEKLKELYPEIVGTTEEECNIVTNRAQKVHDIFKKLYEIIYTDLENKELEAQIKQLINSIQTYTDKHDTSTFRMKAFFTNLAETQYNYSYNKAKRSLDDAESNIKYNQDRLMENYSTKATALATMNALVKPSADTISTLQQNVVHNPHIKIIDLSETNIKFKVTAPLRYFQPSDFEAYENNIYSAYSVNVTDPILKEIFHKTFITQEYQLIIQALISIDLRTNTRGFELKAYNDPNLLTEAPNPHLTYFNCWDRTRDLVYKSLTEDKTELIIPQIIASVQSVNIAENPTFVNHLLLTDLLNKSNYNSKIHFIINDKIISMSELYNLTSKKQKQEQEKQEQEQKQPAPNTTEYTQITADNTEEFTEEELNILRSQGLLDNTHE